MQQNESSPLKGALDGDIRAFQQLFVEFQDTLKSYLYRLLANRNDAEDIAHDTFVRAFERREQYRGDSSLKTWVFQIATNLAYDMLSRRRRWTVDVSAQAKTLVLGTPALARQLEHTAAQDEDARYDIREHIDTCFTCIGKTLPIENQIALMLRDVYAFTVADIGRILDKTEGVVKYLLQTARTTMTDTFDNRCALVNKNGVCHQCSELNQWFNPRQNQQEALMQIEMVRSSARYDREALYRMRAELVREIDPLRSGGHTLQELLLSCNRMAMGETEPPE